MFHIDTTLLCVLCVCVVLLMNLAALPLAIGSKINTLIHTGLNLTFIGYPNNAS